ncbi:preprotein translocase subunit SecD [Plantibacter flavus]|uniref:Protein translocase subunit SecD n=1 Tax=Plantibacter flavus TaxID=150123 RepID=A0A3N2C2W0_9MICO|nr:protein translocase subunit SecD [Plantibacter flavus]ROR81833.1 preprotein translocase subunit SecD [Plantibacter flavus]SMG17151.1 preprotein translocase subunit SecD [Plantibacter flavus]
MAKSTPVKKAWRSLTWLGVILIGLFAINAAGVLWGNSSWAPKLALDLEGGTQIILAPKLESGQTVSNEQLNQAVAIIRQRVDASGVSEAEITTQGQNVVVSIPGTPDEATLNRIESSAKLEFRPVLTSQQLTPGQPSNTFIGEDGASTPYPTPDPGLESTPTASPTNASDLSQVTPALYAAFQAYDCAANADSLDATAAPAADPLITCDVDGTFKYVLGPVEVSGEDLSDASAGIKTTSSGASTGEWAVYPVFNEKGTALFADVTGRLTSLQSPQNQFAIVLDGNVISAPQSLAVISDGKPEISGSFTEESAKTLADQLKFGALPISFVVQSQDTISATLGSTQLESGLIAGLIGLILVVIYTLFQYRLLGTVTIASLVAAAVLTYVVILLMSWRQGFRLSLAGIAGLIVAIGFTADSFIVYFERIKDELRDGRGLESAVEAGWKRAKRTIYAAKGVNLLSAVVLYVLAIGNVRGFALTLGVTTIIDVIVVLLFTHPMMQLLGQTKLFNSGKPFTGLDPSALGAIYRGRAEFRKPVSVPGAKAASSSREAAKRQTIAERKQAALVGGGSDTRTDDLPTDGKDS